MSFPAPRLGASALVLVSLAAGIATIAATGPAPPVPQPGAPVAASEAAPATTVTVPPATTPVPAPTTSLDLAVSPTPRTTPAAPPPSPAPGPSPPAPAPAPGPSPPVIVAQTAQPATINRKGCGGARSAITVELAEPAASVTLHVTGPGGVTRNRTMDGGGTVWTDTLGPYEVTGTATWSVTAHSKAGDTHGALKTVRVVAC